MALRFGELLGLGVREFDVYAIRLVVEGTKMRK
jgi:hypothetical protein